MVANPPAGEPRISPYLCYADADHALEWLSRCFGFTERMRLTGPDGKVAHAELTLADAVVMLGSPGPDFVNPAATAERPIAFVHVYVDDVDAHHATAKAEGVKITSELEDTFYGDRRYMAVDPGGHHWAFAQHVRDVDPDAMSNWWEQETQS